MAKKFLIHGLFLSISLVIGLIGAEVVVRLSKGTPAQARETVENPFLPDPEIGFRYNPESDGVNSRGLYDSEVSTEKAAGVPRVLLLGDSVSIWCDWSTSSPDSFRQLLRKQFEGRIELINGAVSGYTIHQERLQLERQLDLAPDYVLLQYTLNDNFELLHQFDPENKILLTEEARKVYVQDVAGPLGWLAENSELALRVRFALNQYSEGKKQYPWEQYPGFPRAWKEDSWSLAEAELGQIVELSRGIGARVIVVAVPFGPQFDGDLLAKQREYTTYPQTRLGEICGRLGVDFVDLLPAFEKGGGGALFYDLVHMTKQGHRLTADALAPKFEGMLRGMSD